MNTKTIITVSVVGVLLVSYFVAYGLACQTGKFDLSTDSSTYQTQDTQKSYAVDLVALQPGEFSFWFTHQATNIPADGSSSYLTTKDKLSIGLFAFEVDNTQEVGSGGPTNAAAVTASAP